MAKIKHNAFTSWELTEEEELQGQQLTITQVQVIQNLIADTAESLLNLEYDISKPTDYIQQESYKRGQIEILAFLLDRSVAASELVLQNLNPTS